jgi:hypothetical protein
MADPDQNSAAASSPLRSAGAVSLVTAIAVALFYLGWPSARFNGDGVVFSLWVDQARATGELGPLWHPRHLLYCPLAYLFAQAAALAGIKLRAVFLLEILDTVYAAAALFLFQLFCRRLTRAPVLSLLATLLLAASFGFWFFAVEPEVYAANVLAWIACLYAAWSWTGERARSAWWLRAAGMGGLGALAIGCHLTSGLILMVLGWAALMYLRPAAPDWRSRLKAGIPPALLLTMTAFALAGLLYYIGYRVNPLARGQDFAGWVIGRYNPQTGLGYDRSYWDLTPSAFGAWLTGCSRAFLAGADLGDIHSPALTALRGVARAGILICIAAVLASARRLLAREPRGPVLLLLALLPMSVFSLIWEPINFEIKTVLLPTFWLAAALGLADLGERSRRLRISTYVFAAGLLLALFLPNFFGSIRPGSDPERNQDLARAAFVSSHTEDNATVYFLGVSAGYNMGKFYLPYFAGRQGRVMDWLLIRSAEPFPAPLLASLAADRGRPVYALAEVIEPGPALDAFTRQHRLAPDAVVSLLRRFQPALVARRDDGFGLYRLTVP